VSGGCCGTVNWMTAGVDAADAGAAADAPDAADAEAGVSCCGSDEADDAGGMEAGGVEEAGAEAAEAGIDAPSAADATPDDIHTHAATASARSAAGATRCVGRKLVGRRSRNVHRRARVSRRHGASWFFIGIAG